jgi:hypothetical protein
METQRPTNSPYFVAASINRRTLSPEQADAIVARVLGASL